MINLEDLPQNIGNPARRALKELGYTHLEQLTEWTEKDLLAIHGVGPKAVRIIREALHEQNLSFTTKT